MTNESIRAKIADEYPECLLADGFDAAIIGMVEGACRPTVICYDYDKCIAVLMHTGKMTEAEEAQEYLDFNTVGAYVGEYTPLFLHRWRG